MATVRRRYRVVRCPYCNIEHAMTVELMLRRETGLRAHRERAQVVSICKYTGGDFLAAVEVDVPENSRFGRVRAVTLANG